MKQERGAQPGRGRCNGDVSDSTVLIGAHRAIILRG